jgi:hypothetical protein
VATRAVRVRSFDAYPAVRHGNISALRHHRLIAGSAITVDRDAPVAEWRSSST